MPDRSTARSLLPALRSSFVSRLVGLRTALGAFSAAGLLTLATPAFALEVVFDGVSSGEFADAYTFNFGGTDLSRNTKASYDFWVSGDAQAEVSAQLTLDPCVRGCGNPAINYGIYADGQKLQSNADGTYSLTLGDHKYQIHITGLGDGNVVDYTGTVTFSAISATPEPETWVLMLLGFAAAARLAGRDGRPRACS